MDLIPAGRRRLKTDRLTLEPASTEHLEHLVNLNSDADVMRFILGRAATQDETVAEWEKRLGPQSDESRGLGYWVGFAGEDFVGWWSASSFADDRSQPGIGYRLMRAAWGLSLATEGGLAMINLAFAAPDVEKAVASTMATNTASRRVLEKLGMRHVGTYVGQWRDALPGWENGEAVYERTAAMRSNRLIDPDGLIRPRDRDTDEDRS